MSSDLCRYNAVTGEWLKDEVLIKMASQVSRGPSCEGAGPQRNFLRLFSAVLSLLLDLILLFTFLYFYLLIHCVYVCVCEYVCEIETEIDRDREI